MVVFKKIKRTDSKVLIKDTKFEAIAFFSGVVQDMLLTRVIWQQPAVHLAHGYYVQHPDRSWSCHFKFSEGVRSQ